MKHQHQVDDPLTQAIIKQASWFEEKVLGIIAQDLTLFKLCKNILCRDPANFNKPTEDFENYFLNILYEVIYIWNEATLNTATDKALTNFKACSVDFLRIYLKSQNDAGNLILAEDIPKVIELYEKIIKETDVQTYGAIVKSGLGAWLKHRKAQQVHHTVLLNNGNSSIEVLAQNLELNLKAIREIEQGGITAFQELPDRFVSKKDDSISEITLTDLQKDKNSIDKVLQAAVGELSKIRETRQPLYSQIPELNDALGGGFYRGDGYLFVAATGAGKCYGVGTPILCHNGAVIDVERLETNILLMGADGTPRRITSLSRGFDDLFMIVTHNRAFNSFVCNREHILSLKLIFKGKRPIKGPDNKVYNSGDICNIPLHTLPKASPRFLKAAKLWKPENIFKAYQASLPSSEEESDILKIFESFGECTKTGYKVNISPQEEEDARLAEDLTFLGRLMGYEVRRRSCTINSKIQIKTVNSNFNKVHIKDALLLSKKKNNNHLYSDFSIVHIGKGHYYGFTLDGPDRMHLLGDFTVGHNTVCACQLAMDFIGMSFGKRSFRDMGAGQILRRNSGICGMLITTEEPHEDLLPRMASQACNIPYNLLMDGINITRLDDLQKQALAEWYINLNNLMIVNWNKKMGVSVALDLENEISKFMEEYGKKPDFIILDWVGGALGSGAPKELIRLVYQEAADAFEKAAKRHMFVGVAFAQADKSANNIIGIDMRHIAECKTMGRNYSAIIGITNLYSKSLGASEVPDDPGNNDIRAPKQFFFCSKTRKGRNKQVPFSRDYMYQRQAAWRK